MFLLKLPKDDLIFCLVNVICWSFLIGCFPSYFLKSLAKSRSHMERCASDEWSVKWVVSPRLLTGGCPLILFLYSITISICISAFIWNERKSIVMSKKGTWYAHSPSWFQAAQQVVKQFVSITFSHLVRDISGYYYNLSEALFLYLHFYN